MSFSEEFYTTKDSRHRVEITVRDGFPMAFHRDLCDWIAGYLTNNGPRYVTDDAGEDIEQRPVQIIKIFDDDPNCVVNVTVAADYPDPDLERELQECVDSYYGGIALQISLWPVPAGPVQSDRYNHAEYLRRQVEAAGG